MVFLSSTLSYAIGIPLGIALVVTGREGINPISLFNKALGLIIDLLRSMPLIILLVTVPPIIKFTVGKTIGSNTTVVPLIVAAAPYIGCMVESSLKEVDASVIEAAKSMGASTWQIIVKALLLETKPSLLVGAAVSVTTILGHSTMIGFTGGDRLGDIATRYGYHRYQTDMMMVIIMSPVIIVQLIQKVAMRMSRKSDKEIRQKNSETRPGKRVRKQSPGNSVTESRKRAP